jgi:peptidoglycan hydrolase-like protein with peptidoglycan-binding domain
MKRFLCAALIFAAQPALAEDVALVIGNARYDNARNLSGASEVARAARSFQAAGFSVYAGEDLTAEELRDLASDFAAAADGSGRIVIALAGHFAQSPSGGWFLAVDAEAPDLFSVTAEGLPMATLLEVAARAPGQAAVLIGTEDRRIALGHGLSAGLPPLEAPQGVTLVTGDAARLARFAAGPFLDPRTGLRAALSSTTGLSAQGFVPTTPFRPSAAVTRPAPLPAPAPPAPPRESERAAWAAALAQDTVTAYQDFLRRHPDSPNADSARSAITRLRGGVGEGPERGEAALGLGREDRRTIQRNLSLLGYDTRGIDGIFGPGTRGAIAAWQRANGYTATTFLSRDQILGIEGQAARRARELEAEAAARRAEQERLDRAYWQETGARGDEAGLRNYLRRFPDGLYAEVAQQRLAPFDQQRQQEAQAVDRRAWEAATERDTAAAYREYLAAQPRGAFRERAQDRIAALERDGASSQAIRGEEVLGLNAFTRNLVESRLDALGLRPGRVDGVFDADTRRAIRRYQSQRNLPATGYLSQDTVVRLLADSILR